MAQKFGEIAIYLSDDDWLGAPKIGKITKMFWCWIMSVILCVCMCVSLALCAFEKKKTEEFEVQ